MNPEPRGPRTMLEEELGAQTNQLFKFAANLGLELRQSDAGEASEGKVAFDISKQLEAAIRSSLEDEIIPASIAQNGGIEESEIDREVIKKALASLKLATLRKIAQAEGAAASGNLEAVATRIAQRYEWDRAAVARLILSNEDEPSIERAHVTRVFPLEENSDFLEAHNRLTGVIGRYIRIGVARWFLFQDSESIDNELDVKGMYKTYQAAVDERLDVASLEATPHEASVHILSGPSSTLQIGGRSAMAAKAAVKAFESVTGYLAKAYLPLAEKQAKGIKGTLHPASEFLLDLLESRLATAGIREMNLTVARFKVGSGDSAAETRTVGERRPELKAVRFEGEHLLDSVAACRLIALEGRPLVEVAFHAFVDDPQQGTSLRFPVRVTVESDHVAIQTGLGENAHELALNVHRSVTDASASSLSGSRENSQKLAALFNRMKNRAESEIAPDTASIFSDNNGE